MALPMHVSYVGLYLRRALSYLGLCVFMRITLQADATELEPPCETFTFNFVSWDHALFVVSFPTTLNSDG